MNPPVIFLLRHWPKLTTWYSSTGQRYCEQREKHLRGNYWSRVAQPIIERILKSLCIKKVKVGAERKPSFQESLADPDNEVASGWPKISVVA